MIVGKVSARGEQSVITFEMGDYLVSTLSEGGGNGNSGILVGATPELLQKYLPNGTFPLETTVFLVRTPDKNILIDTGHGRKLFDNLESLKIKPEQIDIILLTHAHGDHIGGMLRDGKAAFPNAELYISKAEHDYWVKDQKKKQVCDAIAAYQKKLHLFVPDELNAKATSLLPDIQAIAAYGHTPGHTVFLIKSAQSKLLIWGDLTHASPVQFPHPEVALSFDTDPKQAIETRKKILEYVSKNKIPAGGMHIVFPSIGNVSANKEAGYLFDAFCTCLGI
jgi:glyoxylase-like metal-dependent hydrolase (beta-lactamase superfamily II)